MPSFFRGLVAVLLLLLSSPQIAAEAVGVDHRFANLPLYFEENRGQFPGDSSWIAHGNSGPIGIGSREITIPISGREPVQIRFSKSPALLEPASRQSSYGTLFRENATLPLRHFSELLATGWYPRTQVRFYGSAGKLEFDFNLAPSADPKQVTLEVLNADALKLTPQGHLHIKAGDQTIEQKAPLAFQTIEGHRVPVEARYVLNGTRVSFALGPYDRRQALTIDPVLVYTIPVPIPSAGPPLSLRVDANGSVYMVTPSLSITQNSGTPLPGSSLSGSAISIVKLNPAGTQLQYRVYVGTTWTIFNTQFGIDAQGGVVVAGTTSGFTFPQATQLPETARGPNLFLFRLNPSATGFVSSRLLGGSDGDSLEQMAVRPDGSAAMTFSTTSPDLNPTPGALTAVATEQGVTRRMVWRVDPAGNTIYLAVPTSGANVIHGIAIDAFGSVVLAGESTRAVAQSPAPLTSPPDDSNGVIIKINASGTSVLFQVLLGGSGSESIQYLSLDAEGSIYVTGPTGSRDFPLTAGALQGSLPFSTANPDIFVTKISFTGQQILYSARLGGSRLDIVRALSLVNQDVVIAGDTDSSEFPITSDSLAEVPPPSINQPSVARVGFVTRLNASGTALVSSTVFPGTNFNMQADSAGSVYLLSSLDQRSLGYLPPSTPPNHSLRLTKLREGSCPATVGVDSIVLPPAESGVFVQVAAPAGCTWTSLLQPEWVTASPSISSGSGSVYISAARNPRGTRTGTLYLAGKRIQITQQTACTFAPSKTEIVVDANGGMINVEGVSSPECGWDISSDSPWITDREPGFTTHPVIYVKPLQIPGSRTGKVTIQGQVISIVQRDVPCSAKLTPAVLELPSGGAINFEVETKGNCQWALDSPDQYLDEFFVSYQPPNRIAGRVVGWGQPFTRVFRVSLSVPGTNIPKVQGMIVQSLAGPADFADVPATDPLFPYAQRLLRSGVTRGCAAQPLRYCPDQLITRGEMAAMLNRFTFTIFPGQPPIAFTDVTGSPFLGDINDIVQKGVTNGCAVNPPRFCPSDPVTRSQMALFLMRTSFGLTLELGNNTREPYFTDVPPTSSAFVAVQLLRDLGVTAGCNATEFCPDRPITRREAGIFIGRLLF
jgi:hypothetical protein